MRLKGHLVIMARCPRLGAVKKRLARDIGPLEALRFYRHNGGCLIRMAAKDPRWRTWLAVTPEGAPQGGRGLWPGRYRRIGQGRGDLGARMERLFQALPPGPLVIVGSDVPGITPALINRAFRALGQSDWVIGPAPDGGYYLIGSKRLKKPFRPFAGVRWSSRHTLADTLRNLSDADKGRRDPAAGRQAGWTSPVLPGARGRIAFLPPLRDVDRGADLEALRAASSGVRAGAASAPPDCRA